MKKAPFLILSLVLFFLSSCGSEDNIEPAGINEIIIDQIEYQLTAINDSEVTGVATFTRDSNYNTTILIKLDNTTTDEHPAYIRFNSASEGGEVAITLTVCTCAEGTTVVTKLDDGTPIDFDGLLKLDGHVSIQASSENPDVVIALADIGSNAN